MDASEIMTSPVVSIRPDAAVVDAARLLVRSKVAALPVVDRHQQLVGIVSESDVFRARSVACGYSLGGTVQLTPDELPHYVSDIMHRQVLWVNARDSMQMCIQLMMRHQGRSLPVLHHSVVVGMVSRRDVLAALSRSDATSHREQDLRATAGSGAIDVRERVRIDA